MENNITLETLFERMAAIDQKLSMAIDLLTEKKKAEKKAAEDAIKADNAALASIRRIPNALAARLLRMSTRQLQRVRRQYKFTWEAQGRDVFYHLPPILRAISKFNLNWSEAALEEIKKLNKKIPVL